MLVFVCCFVRAHEFHCICMSATRTYFIKLFDSAEPSEISLLPQLVCLYARSSSSVRSLLCLNRLDGSAEDNVVHHHPLKLNPLINVSHIRFSERDPGQSLVRSQSQSIYTGWRLRTIQSTTSWH